MDTIRVIRLLPGQPPELADIPKGLEALQKEVGGYIDVLGLKPGVDAIVNDEGLLDGLPFNRMLPSSYGKRMVPLVGPIIIAAHDDEGETVSLTTAQVAEWMAVPAVVDLFPSPVAEA